MWADSYEKAKKDRGRKQDALIKHINVIFCATFSQTEQKGKKVFFPSPPKIFFNLNGSRFLKKVWKLQEWTQASGNAYKQCKSAVLIVYWMVWLQLYIVLADKNLIIQISVLCLNFLSFFPLKKMSYISSCALCC